MNHDTAATTSETTGSDQEAKPSASDQGSQESKPCQQAESSPDAAADQYDPPAWMQETPWWTKIERPSWISPQVWDFLPYFDQPVTIHLSFAVAQIDFAGAAEMIVGRNGERRVVPFTVDAVFVRRDPSFEGGFAVLPPQAMEVLHNVMLQPSSCGKMLAVLQVMDGSESRIKQSGATISHVVRPEQIVCISKVVGLPPPKDPTARDGRRIVAP
jgi:hypothetical protein